MVLRLHCKSIDIFECIVTAKLILHSISATYWNWLAVGGPTSMLSTFLLIKTKHTLLVYRHWARFETYMYNIQLIDLPFYKVGRKLARVLYSSHRPSVHRSCCWCWGIWPRSEAAASSERLQHIQQIQQTTLKINIYADSCIVSTWSRLLSVDVDRKFRYQ